MPKITTINPATEEVIAEYDPITKEEAFASVKKAREAFEEWKKTDISDRAKIIGDIGKAMLKRKQELAELITKEMGRPIKESVSEIEKCALLTDYYSQNGKKFLEDEAVKAKEYAKSYVSFEPLGIVFSIMPWNYPFWQAIRCTAPALIVGNTTLLKHASAVTGSAIVFENILKDAGIPDGVFKTLVAKADVAEEVIKSDINAVSLTGSVKVGKRVAELAGSHLKKVVLELGGSNPFIVLQDAEVKLICEDAVKGRMGNAGQSCNAAKRFIVHRNVAEEFTDRYIDLVKAYKIGDPMDPETMIGPMVGRKPRDDLHDQVVRSVKMGAKVRIGGRIPERKGFYYEPTVLTDVTNKMPVFQEETFGPVAPIIVVDSDEEAIREANNTEFGLGASIWSGDRDRAEKLAKDIYSGFVSVNKYAKSDPRLPFGGVKSSGIGREMSRYGMLEFVNIKTVIVG
ncbi:MAG: NAD-dependent succinate-semialdehyde dehydrogenase [Nitrospirota bacterium]